MKIIKRIDDVFFVVTIDSDEITIDSRIFTIDNGIGDDDPIFNNNKNRIYLTADTTLFTSDITYLTADRTVIEASEIKPHHYYFNFVPRFPIDLVDRMYITLQDKVNMKEEEIEVDFSTNKNMVKAIFYTNKIMEDVRINFKIKQNHTLIYTDDGLFTEQATQNYKLNKLKNK